MRKRKHLWCHHISISKGHPRAWALCSPAGSWPLTCASPPAGLHFLSLTRVPSGCGPLSWKWQALSWPLKSGKRADGNGTISLPGCEGKATAILFWLRFLYALSASQKGGLWAFLSFSKNFSCIMFGTRKECWTFLYKEALMVGSSVPPRAAALCWGPRCKLDWRNQRARLASPALSGLSRRICESDFTQLLASPNSPPNSHQALPSGLERGYSCCPSSRVSCSPFYVIMFL